MSFEAGIRVNIVVRDIMSACFGKRMQRAYQIAKIEWSVVFKKVLIPRNF
jgi:hypothetical protein